MINLCSIVFMFVSCINKKLKTQRIGQVIIKKIWKFKLLLLWYATAVCAGDTVLLGVCEIIFCDEEPMGVLIAYYICECFDAAYNMN